MNLGDVHESQLIGDEHKPSTGTPLFGVVSATALIVLLELPPIYYDAQWASVVLLVLFLCVEMSRVALTFGLYSRLVTDKITKRMALLGFIGAVGGGTVLDLLSIAGFFSRVDMFRLLAQIILPVHLISMVALAYALWRQSGSWRVFSIANLLYPGVWTYFLVTDSFFPSIVALQILSLYTVAGAWTLYRVSRRAVSDVSKGAESLSN